MTIFLGKLFSGAIFAVSSLFGVPHVTAPIQTIPEPIALIETVATGTPDIQSIPRKPSVTIVAKAIAKPAVPSVPVPAIFAPMVVVQKPTDCPSGQVFTNGSCQWTASSSAAINFNLQVQARKQDALETAARQATSDKIAVLQKQYDAYTTDIQNLEAGIQSACALKTVTSQPVLTSTRKTSSVSVPDCISVTQMASVQEAADRTAQVSLQAQMDALK